MKHIYLPALTALLLTSFTTAHGQESVLTSETAPAFVTMPASEADLAQAKWINRVVVVFADSPLDPSFSDQIALLKKRPDELIQRDVVVVTDTDPKARSAVRTQLRPRGFALVIVDKDGRVMLRKPVPWDLREITRAIDKTPLRQQEIRDAKEAARTGG